MTRFQIEHRTRYEYPTDASESYAELRVWPRNTPNQTVHAHSLQASPKVGVEEHVDYFGNNVESLSVPFRHKELTLTAKCEVVIDPALIPQLVLDTPVAEARQILGPNRLENYDFLAPMPLVPVGEPFSNYARRFFSPSRPILEALIELNHFIFTRFRYKFGVTNVTTNAAEIARRKQGVCQDFAHFMLAVLRSASLPCRYVSGYIETAQAEQASKSGQPDLIGSAASHAWVEALLPGEHWIGLDPTNNLIVADRHVVIAVGRDYRDVAPLRGSYRGPPSKQLDVAVRVIRLG